MHTVGISVLGNILEKKIMLKCRLRDIGRLGEYMYRKMDLHTVGILVLEI